MAFATLIQKCDSTGNMVSKRWCIAEDLDNEEPLLLDAVLKTGRIRSCEQL